MLQRKGIVKVAATTTALELEMASSQSAMVTDIRYFIDGAQAEDIDVSIDRKRIMQFVVPSTWCLLAMGIVQAFRSIFDVIRAKGLFAGIPLAAGEKMTITAAGAGNYMEVEYDLYDAGDIANTLINGVKSAEYQLFQVISNTDTVLAAGDWPLDQSDLDDVFPQFPGGAVVPANTEMVLRALFGGPCGVGKASETAQHTSRLKMLLDRESILSEDMLGMMFLGDNTVASDTVSYTSYGSAIAIPLSGLDARIKVYEPGLKFVAGQELNVLATVVESTTGGDADAGEIKLGMLFDVKRLG